MSADLLPALSDDIFKVVFEKSPGSLLVKGDVPRFTIAAVSDSYLEVTSSTREAIVGKGFFEAFPEDKTLSDDTNARVIFTRVVNTRQKIDVPAYRFDVFNPATKTYVEHHWSCCNTPIFDGYGS